MQEANKLVEYLNAYKVNPSNLKMVNWVLLSFPGWRAWVQEEEVLSIGNNAINIDYSLSRGAWEI